MTDAGTRLLGLGLKARTVVVGVAGVRARLQSEPGGTERTGGARGGRGGGAGGAGLRCVVIAADASARTKDKVVRLARARGVPVLRGPTAERLGAGLGRPAVQAVGVRDPALASGLARVFLEE